MYLDSAILVKLVVHEPDSAFYVEQLTGQSGSVTAAVSLTECYSALCRKQREGALSDELREQAWERLENFFRTGSVALIPLTEPVLRLANQILGQCIPVVALRSLDAIHLASCWQESAAPLFSNDLRLRQAAQHLGVLLAPLPPPRPT